MNSSSTKSEKLAWKALSTGAGIAGSLATKQVMKAIWPVSGPGGSEPPLNPADRRIAWPAALQWALAAGVGAGLARLVGQRMAAAGWEAATGSPPPGIAT